MPIADVPGVRAAVAAKAGENAPFLLPNSVTVQCYGSYMRLLMRSCSQLELGLATRALPASASASTSTAVYCEPVPGDWEAMQTQAATGGAAASASAGVAAPPRLLGTGAGGGASGAAGAVLMRRRAERAAAAGHKDAAATQAAAAAAAAPHA